MPEGLVRRYFYIPADTRRNDNVIITEITFSFLNFNGCTVEA